MESLQVLVATMNQTDFQRYHDMNLSTDAIFANQADEFRYECRIIGNKKIQMITTQTRGVGINRNIALMYADADILVIADDDMVYRSDYEEIELAAFAKLPDADAIIFNIETIGASAKCRVNTKIERVHFYNALNYGTARIAFRRKSILKSNIYFNQCFGGGTIYSAGEDTLYIVEMLKKGLKIYTYPETIATVDRTTSTWFHGYNGKYFYDKGVLYKAISRWGASALCLQDVIRHRKLYSSSGMTIKEMRQKMKEGRRGFATLSEYNDGLHRA